MASVDATVSGLRQMSRDDDRLTEAFVFTENEKMKDDRTQTLERFRTEKSEEVLSFASQAPLIS